MGNNRNVHMSKRQIERRRRKRLQKRIFQIVFALVLFMLTFCIKNIYERLEDIQETLRKLDTQAHGISQTYVEEQKQAETDYISSINAVEVGKPVERTEEEVLQRLDELGQTDSTIMEIYQNNSQYPKDLLAALANNPEMADFAAGYLKNNGNSSGALTTAEKEQDFPFFLQWDPRWGYRSYGNGNCIGLAGCGPTCLSMALFYLTRDEKLTPNKIAEYSMENGYYVDGTGTAWALMEDLPKLYGIGVTKLSAQASNLIATLDNGGVIICSMGRGDFTLSGHYIVIYGYDSEGFMINDPNCVARSGRKWTFSELKNQMKNIWAYMPAGKSASIESNVSVIYKDVRESQ